MSNQVIEVRLFNKPMARLYYFDNQLCFRYDPEFLQTGLQPSPKNLRAAKDIYSCKDHKFNFGLPGLVADSLPDKFGNDIFDQWLLQKNIEPSLLQPLDRLSYIGERGMGALSYYPSKGDDSKIVDFKLETIFEYAQHRLNHHHQLSVDIMDKESSNILMEAAGYTGGARPKAVIYRKGAHIISGHVPHPPAGYKPEIIKLTVQQGRDYGKIEHIYQQLAAKAGIKTMRTELLTAHGCTHFIIERFDREEHKKLHTQTYAALYDVDFLETVMPLEQLMATILELTNDENQVQEMFTRMLFNIVSGNRDDHSKNTSFVMSESGDWKLAPAYDMTYEYRPAINWYQAHHTSLNNKTNGFTLEDIREVGGDFGIHKPHELLEKVMTTFNEDFPKLAKEYEITKEKADEIIQQTRIFQEKFRPPLIQKKQAAKASLRKRPRRRL